MTDESLKNDCVSSETTADGSVDRKERGRFWIALFEILLIFIVFVFYGAWPTPDVNEQYYVGKAIHFWNHSWLSADPFLNTPDSHWLFYASFGLLSFLFSQDVLVWVGRVLVWLLTACAWRRLSRSLIPANFVSILTAAAFAFYLESFHLAGEWIIGGVEGKGLAFPFVFWGLACFFEGKFNRGWILMGIGSAFHVLVGGWTVLACLLAWAIDAHLRYGASLKETTVAGETTPSSLGTRAARRVKRFFRELLRTLPGLVVGGAISLLGVIPALRLDAGASADVIRESRRIYVFERLQHHLVASSLPWTFLTRFALMTLTVVMLATLGAFLLSYLRRERSGEPDVVGPVDVSNARFTRLCAFVGAAVLFAGIGATIDWGSKWLASIGVLADSRVCAGLLRYYWYRLSDWAVPFGLVFLSTRLGLTLAQAVASRSRRDASRGKQPLTSFFYSGLATLTCGFGVYWLCRAFFYRRAVALAKASAVDGLIPIPKPTSGVSYIATTVILGALLLTAAAVAVWGCRRSRLRDEKTPSFLSPTLMSSLLVWLSIVVVAAPAWRLCSFVDLRGSKVIPRSAPPKESIADGWIDACRWVRDNTPENAIFLVPRGCESFKWHARRAEAGNWKEIPQDAVSIVKWFHKMERFYANPGDPEGSPTRWNQALNVVFLNKGRARVLRESEEDGYQYAIVETPPYTIFSVPEALRRWQEFIDANRVYENSQFVVLKLHDVPGETPEGEDAPAAEN